MHAIPFYYLMQFLFRRELPNIYPDPKKTEGKLVTRHNERLNVTAGACDPFTKQNKSIFVVCFCIILKASSIFSSCK